MEYHVSYSHYHRKIIAVTLVTCSAKSALREAKRLTEKRWVAHIAVINPNTVKTD
jgi:hypothetical protein